MKTTHDDDVVRCLLDRQRGQSISEYAVMLALFFVVVIGALHLIGHSTVRAFHQAAHAIR